METTLHVNNGDNITMKRAYVNNGDNITCKQ